MKLQSRRQSDLGEIPPDFSRFGAPHPLSRRGRLAAA
jgi:hypothetical protein